MSEVAATTRPPDWTLARWPANDQLIVHHLHAGMGVHCFLFDGTYVCPYCNVTVAETTVQLWWQHSS